MRADPDRKLQHSTYSYPNKKSKVTAEQVRSPNLSTITHHANIIDEDESRLTLVDPVIEREWEQKRINQERNEHPLQSQKYTRAKGDVPSTANGRLLASFMSDLITSRIRPEDVIAEMRGSTREEYERMFANVQLLAAHTYAALRNKD